MFTTWKGITLPPDLPNDAVKIMNENESRFTPFVKLFWEQQKATFKKNPKVVRYHSMIVCFWISLASKSLSAYDEIRDSNILILPSRRTLRDYRNVIRPKVGFNPELINELKNVTKNLDGIQRFICLCFDQIKVQSSLVFDKYTDELIGFIDLSIFGDIGKMKI